MKKSLSYVSRLVLLSACTVVLVAQMQHITPFTGTWKTNVAKSQFSPGPPPQSATTVTWLPDGTFTMESVDDKGTTHKLSHPWSDGREVPVEGTNNETVISKYRGHTLDDTWKVGGKTVMTVHAVISADGRTQTATVDGTDEQGRHIHNVIIGEKQ